MVGMSVYETAVRPLLFQLDAERAHNLALRSAELTGRSAPCAARRPVRSRSATRGWRPRSPGIPLANPLGLAAGFDKNGRAIAMLSALGFGHLEIGSVSADASDGNPKPRLFRIPQDEGDRRRLRRAQRRGGRSSASGSAGPSPRPGRPQLGRRPTIPRSPPRSPRSTRTTPLSFGDPPGSRGLHRPEPELPELGPPTVTSSTSSHASTRSWQRLAAEDPRVPVILKLKPTRDAGVLREIVAIADRHPFVSGFAINLPVGQARRPAAVLAARRGLERMPGAVGGPPVEDYVNAILGTLRSSSAIAAATR